MCCTWKPQLTELQKSIFTRPLDHKSRYAFRFVSYNKIQTESISCILFGFSCTTHVMIRHATNSWAGIQELRGSRYLRGKNNPTGNSASCRLSGNGKKFKSDCTNRIQTQQKFHDKSGYRPLPVLFLISHVSFKGCSDVLLLFNTVYAWVSNETVPLWETDELGLTKKIVQRLTAQTNGN